MKIVKIYLVRHGQTEWNKQKRYQGSKDIELDETGLDQAEKLAEKLKNIQWSKVYSSDLQRARKTAETVINKSNLNIPILEVPELREMHFGDWEGETFTSIEEQFPEKVSAFFSDPTPQIIPAGENAETFRERVVKGFEEILTNGSTEDTILAVSHGGTIRVIVCEVMGLPLKEMWEIEQGNTAINILEIGKDGKMTFESVNDTSHLVS